MKILSSFDAACTCPKCGATYMVSHGREEEELFTKEMAK
jgi:hypothetical protein